MKDWGLSGKVIIGGKAGLAVILAIVYLTYINQKAFEKTSEATRTKGPSGARPAWLHWTRMAAQRW